MFAIYDWFGYELPIKERYRLIKDTGFDGVLLWWSEYLNRGEYRKGPQMIREAGLFIENIHTPFQVQNSIWLDNLDGEAAIECYLQCVVDCAEFDIPTMVVHLPDDDKPHNELGLARIKKMAEKAEKRNVNIALENLNNYENLSFVLGHIDSKRVGFCYDCCHHYNYYPEKELLSSYGSRMMALHLHDSGENHIHQLPFDGRLDWSMIMRDIEEAGYSGSISIEAMNWSYINLSASEFLHRAIESAKKLERLKKQFVWT